MEHTVNVQRYLSQMTDHGSDKGGLIRQLVIHYRYFSHCEPTYLHADIMMSGGYHFHYNRRTNKILNI